MICKDISLLTPQDNILYDEVLLFLADKKNAGEFLRFWESDEVFIVMGRVSKEEDLKIDAIKKDRVPVYRRASGGGTVVQGKGCLNYSLVLSKDSRKEIADIRRSYQFILSKVVSALGEIGSDTVYMPISDIALSDGYKKISGNAQKRGKNAILHHGTLLYDFDLALIERYLHIPKDTPEYRKGRPHCDFVENIPSQVERLKTALKKAFDVEGEETDLNDHDGEFLLKFSKNKSIAVNI